MKNKTVLTYYWGAFLLQFPALILCILCHRLFIHLGGQIAAPELINGEMTDPTVGRCVYIFVAGLAFVLLTLSAVRLSKKGKDLLSFAHGICAGIFLWQSIGEDVWHFSVGGIHFACLESISVLPLVILFLLFLGYCETRKALDWGVWCAVLSFAVNWLGHYVLIGVHPIVASVIEQSRWFNLAGIIVGSVPILLGIFFGTKKCKTPKALMQSAILTYYGVGVLSFGLMG